MALSLQYWRVYVEGFSKLSRKSESMVEADSRCIAERRKLAQNFIGCARLSAKSRRQYDHCNAALATIGYSNGLTL